MLKEMIAGAKEGWNETPSDERMQSITRRVVRNVSGTDWFAVIDLFKLQVDVPQDVIDQAMQWIEG